MTTLASAVDERDEDHETVESVAGPIQEPGLAARRVASVDALRGLTIFTMVFVNDMGPAAPSFLHHIEPPRADGMTLADLVFPSFLFIVGVSIPLAFESARNAGASRWSQVLHILGRTASLLLMGVINLNYENDKTLGGDRWGLLAFVSLILAWCSIPREPGRRRQVFIGLKALGVVGLITALAIFRNWPEDPEHLKGGDLLFYGHFDNWVWLRTGWWGILGLIGWAYLTVSLLNLLLGRRREWLMGAMALLMTMHLASHNGGFFDRLDDKPWLGPARGVFGALEGTFQWIESYVGLGDALGSLAAVSMAGCLLGSILRRDSSVASHKDRLAWASTLVAGLFLAGAVTDTFEGINKIGATPTWCFFSAGIAGTVWILLYLIMDVARFQGWAFVFRPAGANPLLAYFLHPITVWVVGLTGLSILDYTGSKDPWVVVGGSAGMALFVCLAAGLFARLGLRVRL